MATLVFSLICTRFVRLPCSVLSPSQTLLSLNNTLMIHHPPMQQQHVAQLLRTNQHLPRHNFQASRDNHCCAINWEGSDNTGTANATRIVILASLGHCTTAADHRGVGFNPSSNKELELLTRSANRSDTGFC